MTTTDHEFPESTFINLHFGQGGIQIGDAIWELFNLEHGLTPDGRPADPDCFDNDVQHCAFYTETCKGKYIPSAILLDLEADVINEIQNGVYGQLFHPRNLIYGQEDASNIFARGFYSIGKDLTPVLNERVRRLAEQINRVRGIVYTHSMGGGTGSGFTAAAMLDIREMFCKCTSYQFSVVPSQQLTSAVVEPYNALLHAHYTTVTDMNMLFDNESLYNICRSKLLLKSPSYPNINRLLAQVFSHITVSERFSGSMNIDLSDLKTNLIPFPNLHFPILSSSPVCPPGFDDIDDVGTITLLRDIFNENSFMIGCPNIIEENAALKQHKYFACALLFRGAFHPREVHDNIIRIKQTLPFFHWCTTGFRCGMCNFPVIIPPMSHMSSSQRNITMLTNTTAVSQVFLRLLSKFELLRARKAFLHWYEREGMPAEDWELAPETVREMLRHYQDMLIDDIEHTEGAVDNYSSYSAPSISGNFRASEPSESIHRATNNYDHEYHQNHLYRNNWNDNDRTFVKSNKSRPKYLDGDNNNSTTGGYYKEETDTFHDKYPPQYDVCLEPVSFHSRHHSLPSSINNLHSYRPPS